MSLSVYFLEVQKWFGSDSVWSYIFLLNNVFQYIKICPPYCLTSVIWFIYGFSPINVGALAIRSKAFQLSQFSQSLYHLKHLCIFYHSLYWAFTPPLMRSPCEMHILSFKFLLRFSFCFRRNWVLAFPSYHFISFCVALDLQAFNTWYFIRIIWYIFFLGSFPIQFSHSAMPFMFLWLDGVACCVYSFLHEFWKSLFAIYTKSFMDISHRNNFGTTSLSYCRLL